MRYSSTIIWFVVAGCSSPSFGSRSLQLDGSPFQPDSGQDAIVSSDGSQAGSNGEDSGKEAAAGSIQQEASAGSAGSTQIVDSGPETSSHDATQETGKPDAGKQDSGPVCSCNTSNDCPSSPPYGNTVWMGLWQSTCTPDGCRCLCNGSEAPTCSFGFVKDCGIPSMCP